MADANEAEIKIVEEYINKVSKDFAANKATEHSFRPALVEMLSKLLSGFTIRNEERRIECGAPDITISKGQDNAAIPVAYIETKCIGDDDLDGNKKTGNKEQFDRYKKALNHIIFTDYLDFHLYEDNKFIDRVRVGEVIGNRIIENKESFSKFLEIVNHFSNAKPQEINTPKELAKMMAIKAKLLKESVIKTLAEESEEGPLSKLWNAFKTNLIKDLSKESFSDIYAQTIAYGMFAARLHDKTPKTFSRLEAAELIPQTNPFLRRIFQSIAIFDVKDGIAWILDDMVEAFKATNFEKVLRNFGEKKGSKDSLTYFYEDFLDAYDPKIKKDYGVFYTPLPIVRFIVNSVDELLKKKWHLPKGLADSSTIKIKQSNALYTDNRTTDKKRLDLNTYHKVQVLDPATGTGTFLAEVVNKIWDNIEGNQGAWQNYVEDHLLPRLNGFEIMMAPYTIAHLKMDMTLSQKEYRPSSDKRLKIFLTNALENSDQDTETALTDWLLSAEAKEAYRIKQKTPVMVMIGNPPYNNKSINKCKAILKEIKEYKKNLNEKKINLDDDYIKFIRLGQCFIEKNDGGGILSYITNSSFIRGITHRQMRKSLMETFDEIYILDLHGYFNEQYDVFKGQRDENVFDIKQGVCISIFVKKQYDNESNAVRKVSKQNLAKIFHFDLYGKQNEKFDFLTNNTFGEIPWKELNPQEPYYFFVPKDFSALNEYKKGFKISSLMGTYNSGVQTKRDKLNIFFTKEEADALRNDFIQMPANELIKKYDVKDGRDWKISLAQKDLVENSIVADEIDYRPFDIRYTNYTGKTKGIMGYPRYKTNYNLIGKENISLVICKQLSTYKFRHVFVSKKVSDLNSISINSKEQSYIFPLYIYPKKNEMGLGETRWPNLDKTIWNKINKLIGFDSTPEQILDYVYGILYTLHYRDQYQELLEIDFPHIPYPKSRDHFNQVVSIGNKLRKLHLMEDANIAQETIVTFPIKGERNISKIAYKDNRVYINDSQYFENVPESAWNFYIGGYQPAQRWLKERKDRSLSYPEITHYETIIAILMKTHHLMQELDAIV